MGVSFRKPTFNSLCDPFGSPYRGQKPSLPLKKEFFLKSPRPSFLIKRAALGNLKASFHCTHWHRFFPLKKAFSKTYPSFLTLKEGSTFLTKPLFPQGREDVTALRCSEPLRSKVGGPKRSSPWFCGMGPPGEESLQFIIYN